MKQTIKCKVHDCKFCDCDNNMCTLKRINIVNCTSGETSKELTMCDSYQMKSLK